MVGRGGKIRTCDPLRPRQISARELKLPIFIYFRFNHFPEPCWSMLPIVEAGGALQLRNRLQRQRISYNTFEFMMYGDTAAKIKRGLLLHSWRDVFMADSLLNNGVYRKLLFILHRASRRMRTPGLHGVPAHLCCHVFQYALQLSQNVCMFLGKISNHPAIAKKGRQITSCHSE
jgi:hypothetical protein